MKANRNLIQHDSRQLFFLHLSLLSVGLKKFMWPVFIGFQLVKTVLLALFLPSILGSFGKIVGKGLSSISSFGRAPMDAPEDLDFKDNHFNSDMMDSLDAAPQTSYEQYTLPYGESVDTLL